MIEDRRVLAVIPARGGSKGVERKNVREIGGLPLIAWTIKAARESRFIDYLMASTDDDEIAEVAREHGCDVPFKRPSDMAQDDTPGMAPLQHALETLEEGFDYAILLQPTSPLRQAKEIDECLELCVRTGASFCTAATAVNQTPQFMFRIGADHKIDPLFGIESMVGRRQDVAPLYIETGAVYVVRTPAFRRTGEFDYSRAVAYVMDAGKALDIDDELDLQLGDWLLRRERTAE